MRSFLGPMAVLLTLFFTAGCVTCDSPFDQHYTTSGGSIQRGDPVNGRVNSAFVPTTPVADPLAPSEPGEQADALLLDREAAFNLHPGL
jgi:hypothetical protein